MNMIQKLDQDIKDILDNAVYDCVINKQGKKLKRCDICMQNMGYTLNKNIICLKELEKTL